MENLDIRCAELGQTLAENRAIEEKLLTDAIGVLEEQGLYAAFLFLKARGGKGGKAVCDAASKFLRTTPKASPLVASVGGGQKGDVLAEIRQLSTDLDDLLLARDLVRQALVYARYHIKAR